MGVAIKPIIEEASKPVSLVIQDILTKIKMFYNSWLGLEVPERNNG